MSRKPYRHLGRCLSLLAVLGLISSGCSTDFYDKPARSASHFDAARVLLAQRTIMPWDEIKAQLSPNFGALAGDVAYTKVFPTTQFAADQIVNAFMANLRAGLPSATEATSLVTDVATGQQTGSTTQTVTPGTAPAAAPAPVIPVAVNNLPGGLPADVWAKIQDDPVLRYELATGLIQRVALLNSELDKIELDQGKKAYLVGLDLDVQPYKRKQPYDVFVDISFFPYQQIFPGDQPTRSEQSLENQPVKEVEKEACKVADLPEVVPLLTMDNLEAQAQTNALENTLQLGLALTGTLNNIGAALDTSFRRDAIHALAGKDRNSLFTVGKSSVNTLAARIGAPMQVDVEREMQAQSHRVYSLVLVSKEYLDCQGPALHVVAQSRLVDSESGQALPTFKRNEYWDAIKDSAAAYGIALPDDEAGTKIIEGLSATVAQRRFDLFKAQLKKASADQALGISDAEIDFNSDVLWQDLQRIDSSYGVVFEKIPLRMNKKEKESPAKEKPSMQTIVMSIANNKTLARINDAGRLSLAQGKFQVSAELHLTATGRPTPDIYLGSKVNDPMQPDQLAYEFPSLIDLGYEKDLKSGADLKLRLIAEPTLAAQEEAKEKKQKLDGWNETYPIRFVNKAWIDAAPKSPVRLAVVKPAKYIVSGANGLGSTKVYIDMAGLKQVKVELSGADWIGHDGNRLTIHKSQSIEIDLSNLVDATTVKITATGYDDAGNVLATAESGDLTVRLVSDQKAP